MVKLGGVVINLDHIVAEVRRIAEAFPKKIYDSPDGYSCLYLDCRFAVEGRRGCIIGLALQARYPETREYLAMVDERPEVDANFGAILDRSDATEEEEQLVQWLRRVQIMQDHGTPWGEAVANADESVKDGNSCSAS